MIHSTKIKILTATAIVFISQTVFVTGATKYEPLSGTGAEKILPGLNSGGLATMFKGFYKWGVGIAILLAVFMVVVGGIRYMTTDAIFDKGEGKKIIQNAFLGLLIVLSSYTILYAINPKILEINLDFNDLKSTAVNTPLTETTGTGVAVDKDLPADYYTNNTSTGYPSAQGGWITGKATNFGYNDSQDNGRGSPLLDQTNGAGINTNNTSIYGVAIPESVIQQEFGISDRKWSSYSEVRKAGVMVTNGTKTTVVPIVDLGPGAGPISKGVVIDETYALNQSMGGDGQRSYKIIKNYYPNR